MERQAASIPPACHHRRRLFLIGSLISLTAYCVSFVGFCLAATDFSLVPPGEPKSRVVTFSRNLPLNDAMRTAYAPLRAVSPARFWFPTSDELRGFGFGETIGRLP